MPLPLINLAYLAVRQLSKPLASAVKKKAKTHPTLRNYILLPPAQWYHRTLVRFTAFQRGLGAPIKIKPLKEEAAVDQAAEMLGEIIIFTIGSACLVIEYFRQRRNESARQAVQNERLATLEASADRLRLSLEESRSLLTSIITQPSPAVDTSKTKTSTENSGTLSKLKDAIQGSHTFQEDKL